MARRRRSIFYRCPVCGEEMLVNEAIIDVAIGAAKFRGEYHGRDADDWMSRMQRRDMGGGPGRVP